jgi:protease IV
MDAIERDFYEDRRRRWRRSAFWRGFAACLLVLVGLAVILSLTLGDVSLAREHVARYSVNGFISDDLDRDELLRELGESDAARAVIVRINSPGGTTAGAEALYMSLRAIGEEKPVVAVLSEIAASGGYVAAIATDHIVTLGNTLTGSIGVIMEYPDVTAVLGRLGVEMEVVRSSQLKAEPSPFRETNPAARAVNEAMVADSYAWFRGLVGKRRGLAGAALDEAANGAVYSGRRALEIGLVDELGGETEALAWLESREAGLSDLPVEDWEPDEDVPFVTSVLGRIASSGGILEEISSWQGAKLYSIGP